jgi:hypothetical protein
MAFTLDFDVCQICCDQARFLDQTGQYLPNVEECCKTGYRYSDNPTQDEVISSLFTVTYPDGTVYTDSDLGYMPPVNASASFTVTGAAGSIAIVADGAMIGSTIYITSITQTLQTLVNSINSGSCDHGFGAFFEGNLVTIYDQNAGSLANGKIITVDAFTLVPSLTSLTLAGGIGDGWCKEFGTMEIEEVDVMNCFKDGVYTFTWTIEVQDSETDEVTEYTKTKRALFTCMSKKCLKELILMSTGHKCPCNDKDIHSKIQQLRTDIESAEILFHECEYDCANEVLQKTQKFCQNVCLDC